MRSRQIQRAVSRDWLLIDELKLGLEVVLVQFPGTGAPRPDLTRALGQTTGIRQIVETGHKRDLFAVAIMANAERRRDLRARLSELDEPMIWEEVIAETHEPAVETWRALAREAAAEENLLE